MPRFNTPCLDCGRLSTHGSRCELCSNNRKREAFARLAKDTEARREKKKLLYNSDYRRRAKEVRANATHCHLCGEGYRPNDPFEADHILAGDPASPLAPAHRSCNQRRGDKPL